MEELSKILAKEAKREIIPSKLNEHFASFEPLLEFLRKIGFDTEEINLELNLQEQLAAGEKLAAEVKEYIQSKNPAAISEPACALYRYLAEEDQPEKADVILAFGAKTMARVEKAVELFNQGLAPKLMFTGGSPIYAPNEPEAEKYEKFALAAGVPESSIL